MPIPRCTPVVPALVAAALAAPSLAQPAILPGHYTGSWTNTTFSVSAGLKADVIVRNGTLSVVLDVDGSVFGDPNPVAFIRSAPITPTGISFDEVGHTVFGDYSVDIDAAGNITISATNVPSGFVIGYNSVGTITGGAISGTGVVNLQPSGTANGIASATRTAYTTLRSDAQVAGGQFGYSVAGLPDVTGDGRGDAVVGAPGETSGGLIGAGAAYIIDGFSGNIVRALSSPGREADGGFGASVAAVPDVNGDGVADVVVGAPDEDPGTNPSSTGRAYVFSGATGALLWKLVPPTPTLNAHFGFAVAGVPDVNGDGRGDIIVGAPDETYAGGPVNGGRVHVYSGLTGGRLRSIQPAGAQASDFFGFAVAGSPDINGDGRGDIIVGSPESSDAAPTGRPGRLYYFSGSTGGVLRKLGSPGAQADGLFGYCVAVTSDTNGDGVPDIVAGAPGEHPGASPVDCGRAHLFSGSTGGLLRKLLPPLPVTNGHFGMAVAGVPDVNGDGRGDVAVGAPGEPGNGSGRVHIYTGATGGRLSSHASIYPEVNGNFGMSVAGVADFSGNARGDLVVGSWRENPATAPTPPLDAGRAYLLRR